MIAPERGVSACSTDVYISRRPRSNSAANAKQCGVYASLPARGRAPRTSAPAFDECPWTIPKPPARSIARSRRAAAASPGPGARLIGRSWT
jgi:hypothetical protein